MQLKYLLLALTVACTQDIATSRILNSAFLEAPLPYCMKRLTYAVMTELCPTYVEYTSEEVHPMQMSREMIVKKWEYKEKLMKNCCTKPCTLSELLSIC